MSLRYHSFGARKDKFLIEFGTYEILLKVVKAKTKTKGERKQFSLTISDGPTTVKVRGYPALLPPLMDERNYDCDGTHKPEPDFEIEYIKNRNELLGYISNVPEDLEFGNWKLEDIDQKGYTVTRDENQGLGGNFNTLMELFCYLSPQDANEFGPVIEDFIREKYYMPIYEKMKTRSKQEGNPESASILGKIFGGSVRTGQSVESSSQMNRSDSTVSTVGSGSTTGSKKGNVWKWMRGKMFNPKTHKKSPTLSLPSHVGEYQQWESEDSSVKPPSPPPRPHSRSRSPPRPPPRPRSRSPPRPRSRSPPRLPPRPPPRPPPRSPPRSRQRSPSRPRLGGLLGEIHAGKPLKHRTRPPSSGLMGEIHTGINLRPPGIRAKKTLPQLGSLQKQMDARRAFIAGTPTPQNDDDDNEEWLFGRTRRRSKVSKRRRKRRSRARKSRARKSRARKSRARKSRARKSRARKRRSRALC